MTASKSGSLENAVPRVSATCVHADTRYALLFQLLNSSCQKTGDQRRLPKTADVYDATFLAKLSKNQVPNQRIPETCRQDLVFFTRMIQETPVQILRRTDGENAAPGANFPVKRAELISAATRV